MIQGANYISNDSVTVLQSTMNLIEDYSIILENYGLEYIHVDHYLQVGLISGSQGWILHISAIRSQIPEVLNKLIPFLVDENIPFKVAKDKETARNLLDGNFGRSKVGKVISVYPTAGVDLLLLASKLIILTVPFKGPSILTDIHLGGLVYTRYGSFNPIIMPDASGKKNRFIYNHNRQLREDVEYIPFRLPEGVDWPFAQLASPVILPEKKILNKIYKPIVNLKTDPRGNVIKALYLSRLFNVKWCVIKQGIKNMWSDENGRDIPDRLLWQHRLHNRLIDKIPLPRIIDFFHEYGNSYLVMEFIKGSSLHDRLSALNIYCSSWVNWSIANRLIALNYLLQLIVLIDRLHQEGFVHRDITPVNFIVDRNNKLVLIDIELAYSLNTHEPEPPFILGTYGFMSPEQMNVITPTAKEDIYGLGAIMINIFTGLAPLAFTNQSSEEVQENLCFFIGDRSLSKLIAACIDSNMKTSPTLSSMKNHIQHYRNELEGTKVEKSASKIKNESQELKIKQLIQGAINGLVDSPTLMDDDLWLSKVSTKNVIPDKQQKEFEISGGFYEGISGILYFLGKAKSYGFDINVCQKSYNRGWDFVNSQYLKALPDIPPGLYGGAAGIALALFEGVRSGLVEDEPKSWALLHQCLELSNKNIDLAAGIVGQGIATITCSSLLGENILPSVIVKYKDVLLAEREKGYWIRFKNQSGKYKHALSLSYGNTGIIWFLLEYLVRYPDADVKQVVDKELRSLGKLANTVKAILKEQGCRQIIAGKSEYLDGIQGMILVFIRAYHILKIPFYKQLAEEILDLFPPQIISDNFILNGGLAGLGQLYLNAYQIFGSDKWLERADWIAHFFMHTSCKVHDGSCYWRGNNSLYPTADFMVGNSGIIYFLTQYLLKDGTINGIIL